MADSISSISAPQQFAQQNQDVPAELVPLPSEGKVYPQGSALHNKTSVSIRAMTAKDEDILTSRALLKTGKAIPTLLQGCIIDKTVNVGEMLAGDRNAVLIGIRITGYGAEYKVVMTCPSCGGKASKEIDLSQVPIKRIPEDAVPSAPGTNQFSFKLPMSGKIVIFKLLTGNDEAELLATFERTRKAGLADEIVTTRLRSQVISIDGEEDKGKLANVIRNLPARDSISLRQYIDRVTPGVDLTTTFECPSCGDIDEEVEVPLGTEFFWPKA